MALSAASLVSIEFGPMVLADAFPQGLREKALEAVNQVTPHLIAQRTIYQFRVYVQQELVHITDRLFFKSEHVATETGTDVWFMVRALQSRSLNGYERQRAVRDLLVDVRPWTAPFIVALIGEYIEEILEDIMAAATPHTRRELAMFISANPAYWQTTKRRVQSYHHIYYRSRKRADYVGFHLINLLEAELDSHSG